MSDTVFCTDQKQFRFRHDDRIAFWHRNERTVLLSDTDDRHIGDIPETCCLDLFEYQPGGFGDFGLFHIQRRVFFVKELLQEILHVRACRHRIDPFCHQFGGCYHFVRTEFEQLLVIFVALGIGNDKEFSFASNLPLIQTGGGDRRDIVRNIVRQGNDTLCRREV